MAIVSTITIGADTFSVYAITSDPVADADSYFAAHIDAAEWTVATTLTKQQALISSFRMIEQNEWTGTPDSSASQFPGTGITKRGEAVADGTPDDIAHGQFEFALALLKDADQLNKNSTASNVKGVGAGSAKVEFFYPLPGSSTRWPLQVNGYLAGYLDASNDITALKPYVNGTSVETGFTDLDGDRSEGFA